MTGSISPLFKLVQRLVHQAAQKVRKTVNISKYIVLIGHSCWLIRFILKLSNKDLYINNPYQ